MEQKIRKGKKSIDIHDPLKGIEDVWTGNYQKAFEEMVTHWTGKIRGNRYNEGRVHLGKRHLGTFCVSKGNKIFYVRKGVSDASVKHPYRPSLEDLFLFFLVAQYGYIFAAPALRISHQISQKMEENQELQRRKCKSFLAEGFLQRLKIWGKDIFCLGEAGKAIVNYSNTRYPIPKVEKSEKQLAKLVASLYLDPAKGYECVDHVELRYRINRHIKGIREEGRKADRLQHIFAAREKIDDLKTPVPRGYYLGDPATCILFHNGRGERQYKEFFSRFKIFKQSNFLDRFVLILPAQGDFSDVKKEILAEGKKTRIDVDVCQHEAGTISFWDTF